MATKFVVGLSCTAVQEVPEPKKHLLYSLEITWSDDSTSSKEVSSDDLNAFRNNLKTEVYKNKPDVVIPEVPDGKVGGFASKAKKAEKRKKNIDEFCKQIINLPHVQGKLQAIASKFETASPTITVTTTPHPTSDGSPTRKSETVSVQNHYTEAGNGNDLKISPEAKPEPEVESDDPTPESDYAEVIPDGRNVQLRIPPGGGNSKLQYVEIEIIAREKRETRDATSSPVYAEVVMQKSSSNSEWLKSAIDADDSDDDPNERKRSTPNVPPRISVASSNEHKVKDCHPSPDVTEVSEKAEVHAPEQADEMTDSAENSIVLPMKRSADPEEKARRGVFDAAMMSNFPSRTLIPLPPTHKPKKCPASSDVKLSKNELPSPDVPNICIVAISGCKNSGENTLSFKRNQRAHLLYTTDVWWFISTGDSIGWVPADFWRIVTNSKTVSGKTMAPFAPWNFGVLVREECEALLKTGNQLDFLVRESAKSAGLLVLSVKKDDTIHHFGIHVTETGFCNIGQHYFQTLHNVVLYYMKHDLFTDDKGNGCQLGRLFVRPPKK